MARYSTLRASDADRDAVAERLRQAAVEGRLDPDELEERLHRALRARTYGELDGLVGDLPRRSVPTPRRTMPAPAVAAVLAVRLIVTLAIVAALIAAVAVTAMWWLLGLVVWLSLRAGRGSRVRRSSAWHHHPRSCVPRSSACHHHPRAWRV